MLPSGTKKFQHKSAWTFLITNELQKLSKLYNILPFLKEEVFYFVKDLRRCMQQDVVWSQIGKDLMITKYQ